MRGDDDKQDWDPASAEIPIEVSFVRPSPGAARAAPVGLTSGRRYGGTRGNGRVWMGRGGAAAQSVLLCWRWLIGGGQPSAAPPGHLCFKHPWSVNSNPYGGNSAHSTVGK